MVLCSIYQRYKLKAMSIQLRLIGMLCSIYQRYKLKAIHNGQVITQVPTPVVLNISKIQTESNSQLTINHCPNGIGCAQYIKDTNWKQFTTAAWEGNNEIMLCSIYQRYKLKAIHNFQGTVSGSSAVVLNISKIQTESNSQLPPVVAWTVLSCAQYIKDTNWKQFTTISDR